MQYLKSLPLALAAAISSISQTAQADVAKFNGSWESMACEVRPQIGQDGSITEWWLTRKIEMSDGRIAAEFTTYGQPGCQFPLNILGFAGRVDDQGSSDVVDGALSADLTIDEYVRITPMAQPFADFLNSIPAGSCGTDAWVLNEAQEIHETGCTLLGVAPNEPTVEYEILAIINDMLYFGARPVDGTFIKSPDKRPHALLVPLKRSN